MTRLLTRRLKGVQEEAKIHPLFLPSFGKLRTGSLQKEGDVKVGMQAGVEEGR